MNPLVSILQFLMIGGGVMLFTHPDLPAWIDLIGYLLLYLGLDWRYARRVA